MISLEHGFLFIHIPKTAGNSIQNVLKKYSEDDIVCLSPLQDGVERFEVRSRTYNLHKHSTLYDYYRELGEATLAGLYKFTCVRNPWERLVSYFFSPHRGDVRWSREGFLELLETVPPASQYLELPNATEQPFGNVDSIIRFESLDQGFRAICGQIGIPAETLPVRNRSFSRHDYRDYYDPQLVEAVAHRYRAEIEYFGYAFDEAGTGERDGSGLATGCAAENAPCGSPSLSSSSPGSNRKRRSLCRESRE